MTARVGAASAQPPPPRSRWRAVARLAWPAAVSYLLNNVYRINDQFWIQGLGGAAQAATGAVLFVLIGHFAFTYLACGGALTLISQAEGARDRASSASAARHALAIGAAIGLATALLGPPAAGVLCDLLGLAGEPHAFGRRYLATLFVVAPAMVLAPVLDHVFIGLGNTRIPMLLQGLAVALNYVLNPVLIYGTGAVDAMGDVGGAGLPARAAAALAGLLPASLGDGLGIEGAALATGASRLVTTGVALLLLWRHFGIAPVVVRVLDRTAARRHAAQVLRIVRISAPVAASIAVYAAAYWGLLAIVIRHLPPAVTGGLGVGFQVFEGIAFPTYLGTSLACASLVGNAIGAGDTALALEYARGARVVGRALGVLAAVAFLLGGRFVAPLFTLDPDVLAETLVYVQVLAFSQYWVATQVINEKVLLGAGHTRPIVWITGSGDLLRIPLAWWFALSLELGAAGVWWAINATTLYKAGLLWWVVERGGWLGRAK